MMRIALSDGSSRQVPVGVSVRDAALEFDPGLSQILVCATVDGELRDLNDRLTTDCRLAFHTMATPEGRAVLRHSAAHIVAQAVKRLFPDAVLGMGPANGEGFYQDFDPFRPIEEGDLERTATEMVQIVKEDLPIERIEMSKGDARALLIHLGEVLKVEVLEQIKAPTVTFYRQGDYIDLCRGPHVPSTGLAAHAHLTGIGQAMWQDDPHAEILARVYGTLNSELIASPAGTGDRLV